MADGSDAGERGRSKLQASNLQAPVKLQARSSNLGFGASKIPCAKDGSISRSGAGRVDNSWQFCHGSHMAHALTDHYEEVIDQLIKSGRFANRSEVVRAGLKALEEKYLE